MKIKIIVAFVWLLTVCHISIIAQNVKTVPSRVIVLCDVSNSITQPALGDSNRIADMKKMAKQLLRHYPKGSKISFFLISSNAIFVPFIEFNATQLKQRTAYKVKRELDDKEDELDEKLTQASKTAEKQSCILTSIENSFNLFASDRNENPQLKNELVIFSDMLEQCYVTTVGDIWMNDKKGPLLSKDAKQRMLKYTPPNNWASLQIHATIINISARMYPETKNALQNIWTTLLGQMGADRQVAFLSYYTFAPSPGYEKKAEFKISKF